MKNELLGNKRKSNFDSVLRKDEIKNEEFSENIEDKIKLYDNYKNYKQLLDDIGCLKIIEKINDLNITSEKEISFGFYENKKKIAKDLFKNFSSENNLIKKFKLAQKIMHIYPLIKEIDKEIFLFFLEILKAFDKHKILKNESKFVENGIAYVEDNLYLLRMIFTDDEFFELLNTDLEYKNLFNLHVENLDKNPEIELINFFEYLNKLVDIVRNIFESERSFDLKKAELKKLIKDNNLNIKINYNEKSNPDMENPWKIKIIKKMLEKNYFKNKMPYIDCYNLPIDFKSHYRIYLYKYLNSLNVNLISIVNKYTIYNELIPNLIKLMKSETKDYGLIKYLFNSAK